MFCTKVVLYLKLLQQDCTELVFQSLNSNKVADSFSIHLYITPYWDYDPIKSLSQDYCEAWQTLQVLWYWLLKDARVMQDYSTWKFMLILLSYLKNVSGLLDDYTGL